jgi:hypothetical protein
MPASAAIAEATVRLCQQAAELNRALPVRRGCVVELNPEIADDILITADIHGHRLNFRRVVELADLAKQTRRHLLLQEVCHGGPQYPGGGCMSHLLLEDVAKLIVEFPHRVHFILSNHELSELTDNPIMKSRRVLNLNFRCGIQEMYGDAAESVRAAYRTLIASLPLAVRLSQGIFISHSLPEKIDSEGFDADVFNRALTEADLLAGGGAYRVVWGRDFRQANAEAFAQAVGAEVLIHGHEPCANGARSPNSRQVIIDSCGQRGTFVLLPIGQQLTAAEVLANVRRLYARRLPGEPTA